MNFANNDKLVSSVLLASSINLLEKIKVVRLQIFTILTILPIFPILQIEPNLPISQILPNL